MSTDSTHSADARTTLAYLMWCYRQGYLHRIADAASLSPTPKEPT